MRDGPRSYVVADNQATIVVGGVAVARVPLRIHTLTTRLLERTLRFALEGLAPHAEVRGGGLAIGASEALAAWAGDAGAAVESIAASDGALGVVAIEVSAAGPTRADGVAVRIAVSWREPAAVVRDSGPPPAGVIALAFDEALAATAVEVALPCRAVAARVEAWLVARGALLAGYLRAVLGRALARHGQVHAVCATPEGWRVTYFEDAVAASAAPVVRAGEVAIAAGTAHGDDVALDRLDRLRALLVLVLEGRSFDHVLGGLPDARRRPAERAVDGRPVEGGLEEAHAPTFYRLADEFMICDHYFAAHPGSAWANRWAILAGDVPPVPAALVPGDPDLGFLGGRTVLQLLEERGVDWLVFESDLATLRLFDRYRLDDRRVVPLDDPVDGLAARLARPGALPRVMYIEPPLADGTAGALARAQELVGNVCNTLWQSGAWADVTLLITCDHAGGLGDHVAAPAGRGARVPAFVVSPYVGAGSVCHRVLDHFAIVKTILVHNRARLGGVPALGPGVDAAPHLGELLELEIPRPPPGAFSTRRRRASTAPVVAPRAPAAEDGLVTPAADDLRAALRGALAPEPR